MLRKKEEVKEDGKVSSSGERALQICIQWPRKASLRRWRVCKFSILWDIQENCWKKKPPGRKHSKGKALSYGNPCLFQKEQRTLWLEVGKWEKGWEVRETTEAGLGCCLGPFWEQVFTQMSWAFEKFGGLHMKESKKVVLLTSRYYIFFCVGSPN